MQLKTQLAYVCARTKPHHTARMKNVFHFATCIKDEVPKIPQICPSVKVSQPMNHQLSLEQCSLSEQTIRKQRRLCLMVSNRCYLDTVSGLRTTAEVKGLNFIITHFKDEIYVLESEVPS